MAYRENKAGIALYILFSKGETNDGQSSAYTYNALGARITNVQVRENQNVGNQNGDLLDGSHGVNYLDFLKDGRFDWQRVFESQVGTTHQNDFETVTKHYTVDYLSIANRGIMVTEDGSFTQRYVYEENGARISAEFGYAEGTHPGGGGENLQSDFAATDIRKVWYRTSHLGSTLFAVDESGEVISHTVYDPWGNPLTETYTDANFSGLDNANNFTGYTWDEVLGLYFAQNRFYDATDHRFTQEDIVKDGGNWYVYCGNNSTNYIDINGLKPGDKFDTLDDAAIDAAKYLMEITIDNDEEMLATFYQVGSRYSYRKVTNEYGSHEQRKLGFYISWNSKPLAVIHTHVFYDVNNINNIFSTPENSSNPNGNDATFVTNTGIPLYLAAPTGEVKVLEPVESSYMERLVCSEALADPKYTTYVQFSHTLAWNLFLNRFSEFDPMEIVKVRMEHPGLYDTLQELLKMEEMAYE